MNRIAILMAMATTLIVATHAQAIDLGLGIFKKKKPEPVAATPTKAEPVQQVKKLLTILQSDSDVEHRKTAAEELRTLDPRANPEIIAQLVASMQKDPSPTVRAAAADSLGAIKHVYPAAGTALEAVEKGDPNADVRSAAKAAIWQYSLNGYKATATADLGQTAEPPLSTKRPTVTPNPSTVGQADAAFRPITQGIGKGAFFQQTTEPPLAKAKPKAPPAVVPETKPVILPPPSTTKPTTVAPPVTATPVVAPPVVAPPVVAPPVVEPTFPSIPTVPSGTGVPTIASPPSR